MNTMTNFNLSKEEAKYILNDLLCGLDGCKYGGSINLTPKKLEKLPLESFDVSKKEFELIKSISKKLSLFGGSGK